MMLLEVLIAVLVFSIGVLGIVGLQTAAMRQSADAGYRAQAAMLADEALGTMWANDRSYSMLNSQWSTTGSDFTGWKSKVSNALPGVHAGNSAVTPVVPSTLPTVSLTPLPNATAPTSTRVVVTVYWQAPSDPSGAPNHSYVITTEIK